MKHILTNYILSAVFILCFIMAGQPQASAAEVRAAAINSVAQEPTPTDDGGPCAAAYLLGSDSPDLVTLRLLRDGVLAKTTLGQKLTEIYYAKSSPLIALLDSSPALKNYARKALEAVMPAIKIMLNTK